jgi:predicted transposase YbfD/YdcC
MSIFITNDAEKLDELDIKWNNGEIDDLTFVKELKSISPFNRNTHLDIETTLILKKLYKKYDVNFEVFKVDSFSGVVDTHNSGNFQSDEKIEELIQTIIYKNRESNIDKLND